jgi:hypothetical protein
MSAIHPVDLPEWRRSSRCDTSACVEVAPADAGMRVRDTAGTVLAFSAEAWRVFLAEARESKLTKAR